MHVLKVIVLIKDTDKVKDGNWSIEFFNSLGMSLSDHVNWIDALSITSEDILQHTIISNISEEKIIGSTEIWKFVTREGLDKFFQRSISDDPTVNNNRPWASYNEFLNKIIDWGVYYKVLAVDPNGVEEVIYDNTELVDQ